MPNISDDPDVTPPHGDKLKKAARPLKAEPPPPRDPEVPRSQPHATTEDQINEMESEGQAPKPGQDT